MDLTAQIVTTVAQTENTDAEDLPPLYDAVDVEALAQLIGDVECITFHYHNSLVRIEDGEITAVSQ